MKGFRDGVLPAAGNAQLAAIGPHLFIGVNDKWFLGEALFHGGKFAGLDLLSKHR